MPLLPLPLLALLAAAAAPAPPLPVPLGGVTLPLAVALEVRTGAGGGEVPLAWRSAPPAALVGTGATADAEVEVRLEPAPDGARRLVASLRWRRAAGLVRAAVRLGWPGAAPVAVGRDLAPAPLVAPLRIGRGTPLVAWAGPALLAGGPGLVAARLEPAPRGEGLEATLFLDDASERPFATYPRCLTALPPLTGQGGHGWAALEHKRAWTEAPRAAGDEDRLEATLVPLAPRAPGAAGGAGPLVVERWPAGARAAVVLTDHADRTDPDALRAVLYGHSDPRAEGGRGAGVLGRGLAFTRSFFVRPGRGTLEDPETARLAARLVAEGSEVALHSVSDGRDDRPAVAAGLAEAAPFRPATWIDHEPYVNCEALSAEGAGLAAPYGVRDLLLAGGIRWGWAAGDVAGFRAVEVADLFEAAPAGSPSPALYPLPEDPRLWIFQSSFFYEPPAALAEALSDAALDRLERGRGLFVAHTYLGAGPAETRGRFHGSRLCVRPAPGGGLEIDPALDEALARLAARVARGTLLALPWAEVGDRLRALADVEVRYREDGTAEVVNHGGVALPGLTLRTGRPGLEWWVDGRRADGEADGARIWFDLPARSSRVVRASRWFWPVALLPAAAGSP